MHLCKLHAFRSQSRTSTFPVSEPKNMIQSHHCSARRAGFNRRLLPVVVWSALCYGFSPHVSSMDREAFDLFRAALRDRLATPPTESTLMVPGGEIGTLTSLIQAYRPLAFEPLWIDETGLNNNGRELLSVLAEAPSHGISARRYRLDTLDHLASGDIAGLSLAGKVAFELLLTESFLLYAADLIAGRVDPAQLDPLWVPHRRIRDLPALLARTTEQGSRAVIEALTPPHPEYAVLRAELQRIRNQPGATWSPIPGERKLALASQDERVTHLERALNALGYLDTPEDNYYDDATVQAVRAFQESHGLEADGVAGRKTLTALNNAHPQRRLRTLELNLERWRWLPDDLGVRHLRVNVAGFDLRLIDEGRTKLAMSVIVGREARRSPVISELMTYLVLNPSWNLPHKIAVQDKLPLIQKDPGLLEKLGYEVYRDWKTDSTPVDPKTIDWSSLGPGRFPYRLKQRPGPENALGRIKFMFPNKFAVYLHDTPSRELFTKSERAFSSGCIRIERPIDLALALLDDPTWTADTLEAALKRGTEQVVRLKRPVPVHLLYWTAWVDNTGTVRFHRDIYGRDKRLDQALQMADAGQW